MTNIDFFSFNKTSGSDYLNYTFRIMPVLFSKSCNYALQAMLYLSMRETRGPILQRDISAALNIPPHFLGKILQALVKNRLLVSQKGKNGGFILSRPASQITPLNIVQAIDGPLFLDDCVLGFPGCSDENPCPMHVDWQSVKAIMLEFLQRNNLETLGDKLDTKLESIKEVQIPF